jgi:hypothetical protein
MSDIKARLTLNIDVEIMDRGTQLEVENLDEIKAQLCNQMKSALSNFGQYNTDCTGWYPLFPIIFNKR